MPAMRGARPGKIDLIVLFDLTGEEGEINVTHEPRLVRVEGFFLKPLTRLSGRGGNFKKPRQSLRSEELHIKAY